MENAGIVANKTTAPAPVTTAKHFFHITFSPLCYEMSGNDSTLTAATGQICSQVPQPVQRSRSSLPFLPRKRREDHVCQFGASGRIDVGDHNEAPFLARGDTIRYGGRSCAVSYQYIVRCR